MSEKDIVQVFKSLKKLRKIEKTKGDKLRHQSRYPESEKEKQWEEFYKVVEHCMDYVITEMIKAIPRCCPVNRWK